ncbi:DUF1573 domain-containing protein [Cyclobacterium jeungdonense]|uniref:DUF1573 domain-containing protein n=1 Tax=Cyclobacterium jeungdonense TaxID=708087 RepID=A0ABT8C578_9BACT|nr:DUF1573 domain-containing protein [Cyclobacterium jeungdonense]MDN3686773.1 DUF1573 domain-containing protein [Cyclobacterium jeungdonense]
MKRLVTFVLAIVFGASLAMAQEKTVDGPVITFEESSKDFGDITQGDKVENVFKFENTGNAPLIISNVAATCGCTVPSWPKEPIAPGKKGEIKVSFNSAGKMGKQNSVVRIYSNATEPIEKVSMISNVLPKSTR